MSLPPRAAVDAQNVKWLMTVEALGKVPQGEEWACSLPLPSAWAETPVPQLQLMDVPLPRGGCPSPSYKGSFPPREEGRADGPAVLSMGRGSGTSGVLWLRPSKAREPAAEGSSLDRQCDSSGESRRLPVKRPALRFNCPWNGKGK